LPHSGNEIAKGSKILACDTVDTIADSKELAGIVTGDPRAIMQSCDTLLHAHLVIQAYAPMQGTCPEGTGCG